MRILFLATCYPCESSPIEAIFHRTVSEALVRQGVNVEVLAPVPWIPPGFGRFSSKYAAYDKKPAFYTLNGVTVHRPRYLQIPQSNIRGWTHKSYARMAIRQLKKGFDIIHAQYAYPCGLAAVEAGRKHTVPVVVTVHGSDVNSFPDISELTRRLFHDAICRASVVTAVGRAVAAKTEERTGRMPVHLPIGIRMGKFINVPDKHTARCRLNLPPDVPVVLFAGDLLEAKGVRELISALESLSDKGILGLFVGDGPLRQEVMQSNMTRADGTRPNEEMPYYMAASDLFVLPSYSEGLPTVLVESGAVGLPILATSVGGIPELLENNRGWLVASHSSEALSNAIQNILDDPKAAIQRAKTFRCHVKENYDVDQNVARLIKIYGNCVQNNYQSI